MPREAEIGPGPSVVLSGYGPVGRAYAERLIGGALPLRLAAVRTSAAEGLPPEPRTGWGPLPPLAETLERTGAAVLAQAVPSSPAVREQAAADALSALRRGVHVVTATKSHLLSHWGELGRAAAGGAAASGSRAPPEPPSPPPTSPGSGYAASAAVRCAPAPTAPPPSSWTGWRTATRCPGRSRRPSGAVSPRPTRRPTSPAPTRP
ncbi:hypothetical protein [Streptomyces rapamycinicus]|uniref:hypothetical protein n=1 Tax=Streptomyces rapamycinicus TaxID=1226757 RepID=UPI0020742BC6|nr:hypothetical protein [Streptomyces rapamycinicus]